MTPPLSDQGRTDTETYSRLHQAFIAVGRKASLDPFTVRLALALREHDRPMMTSELVDAMRHDDGSIVRHGLGKMYATGLATGVGRDGGVRRQGVETRITLTRKGRGLADRVLKIAYPEGD